MRRVAIIQSSYIPWRGYFAAIGLCDTFVYLDSVQFTRRDWRSRNAIKTPNGKLWLTVPVRQKGNYLSPIDAMEIAEGGWEIKHLRSIESAYKRSQHFATVFPLLEALYRTVGDETLLSTVNRCLTAGVCGMLGISTALVRDVDILPRAALEAMDPTERLANLALACGASEYLSGPSARSYLDEARFARLGISVAWMDYSGLAEYKQLWNGFEPALSIVDTLLNLGTAAARQCLEDVRALPSGPNAQQNAMLAFTR